MRDETSGALLTDAGISSTAFATSALLLNKTPSRGTWLQFIITKTGTDSDERLDVDLYAKDTDASWATTDAKVGALPQQGSGLATNGTVVLHTLLQTDKQYAKPRYILSGTTPGFTIVCAVVSGPSQEAVV
jgi:hypothetical protein